MSGQESNIKYKLCSPGYKGANCQCVFFSSALNTERGQNISLKMIKAQRTTTHSCYTVLLDSQCSLFYQHDAYKLQKIIAATATLGDYIKFLSNLEN